MNVLDDANDLELLETATPGIRSNLPTYSALAGPCGVSEARAHDHDMAFVGRPKRTPRAHRNPHRLEQVRSR